MAGALIELIAANAAFVGTHFAMSHHWRARMVKTLGPIGFQLAYSAVSFATLAWVFFAFKRSPAGDLGGSGEIGWAIATLLTLPAMILLAGSFVGNPALPTPQASAQARVEPRGVFRITRHPMMWSFALWALSHIIIHYSWRTTITAFAVGVLALVGARLQDRKKELLMGEAWTLWENRTSFWPRWRGFAGAGAFPWAVGLMFFVLFSWMHLPIGGIPAGIWRWF